MGKKIKNVIIRFLTLLTALVSLVGCGGEGSGTVNVEESGKFPEIFSNEVTSDFFVLGLNVAGNPEFVKWLYADDLTIKYEGNVIGEIGTFESKVNFYDYVQFDNWNFRIGHDLSINFDTEDGSWDSLISGGRHSLAIFPVEGSTKTKLLVKEFGDIKLIYNFYEIPSVEGLTALYNGDGMYGEEDGIYSGEKFYLSDNISQYELYHKRGARTLFLGYQYPGLFQGTFSYIDPEGIEVLSGKVKLMDLSRSEKLISDADIYDSEEGIVLKIYFQDQEGNLSDCSRSYPQLSIKGCPEKIKFISKRQFISPVLTDSGWISQGGIEYIFDGVLIEGANEITVALDGGPPWDGKYSSSFEVFYSPAVSVGDPVVDEDGSTILVPSNDFAGNWILLHREEELVGKFEVIFRDIENGSGSIDLYDVLEVLSRPEHNLSPDSISIGYGDRQIRVESERVPLVEGKESLSSLPLNGIRELMAIDLDHEKEEVVNISGSAFSDSSFFDISHSVGSEIEGYQMLIQYSTIAEIISIDLDVSGSNVNFSFISDLCQRNLDPTLISGTGSVAGEKIQMTGTYTDNEGFLRNISFTGTILEDPFIIHMKYFGDGFNGSGEVFIEPSLKSGSLIELEDLNAISTLEGDLLSFRFKRKGVVWYPFPYLQRIIITSELGEEVYSYYYTEHDDRSNGLSFTDHGIFMEVFNDGSYLNYQDSAVSIRCLDFSQFGTGIYYITFQFYFSDSIKELRSEFYYYGDYSDQLSDLEIPVVEKTNEGYDLIMPEDGNYELQFFNKRFFYGTTFKGYASQKAGDNIFLLQGDALENMKHTVLEVNALGMIQYIYEGGEIVAANFSEVISLP